MSLKEQEEKGLPEITRKQLLLELHRAKSEGIKILIKESCETYGHSFGAWERVCVNCGDYGVPGDSRPEYVKECEVCGKEVSISIYEDNKYRIFGDEILVYNIMKSTGKITNQQYCVCIVLKTGRLVWLSKEGPELPHRSVSKEEWDELATRCNNNLLKYPDVPSQSDLEELVTEYIESETSYPLTAEEAEELKDLTKISETAEDRNVGTGCSTTVSARIKK